MSSTFKKLFLLAFVVVITVFAAAPTAFADIPITGWAWSDTIGWVSLTNRSDGSSVPYGVSIGTGDALTGYGWSDNVGWIKFDPTFTGPAGAGYNYAARMSLGGWIIGWAKYCSGTTGRDCASADRTDGWDGWVQFNYSTAMNLQNRTFVGYGWGSEIVGWLKSFNLSVPSNTAPGAPQITAPAGILKFYVNTPYDFTVQSTDSDGNHIFYQYDQDNDGTGDEAIPARGVLSSGTSATKTLTFASRGNKTLTFRASDVAYTSGTPSNEFNPVAPSPSASPNPTNSASYLMQDSLLSPWATKTVTVENQAPTMPEIQHQKNDFYAGHAQVLYVAASDPENDTIHFILDFGDGTPVETWAKNGFTPTQQLSSGSHTWAQEGVYTLKVWAEDDYNPAAKSSPRIEQIYIVSTNPAPTGSDPYGYCAVSPSNTPLAYSDVTWTVFMGGVLDLRTSWNANNSYSTTSTYTTKYTTSGLTQGPKVWAKDLLGRLLQLDQPGTAPNCPTINVQPRPIVARVVAGKSSVTLPPDSTATSLTLGSSEVIAYLGQSAKIQMGVGGGMRKIRCTAYDYLVTDPNAPKINSGNWPNIEFTDDTQKVMSFQTQTFNVLGDYKYRMRCQDQDNNTVEDYAMIHVVAKPQFNDF